MSPSEDDDDDDDVHDERAAIMGAVATGAATAAAAAAAAAASSPSELGSLAKLQTLYATAHLERAAPFRLLSTAARARLGDSRTLPAPPSRAARACAAAFWDRSG